MRWFQRLVDVVAPRGCAACDAFSDGEVFCSPCRALDSGPPAPSDVEGVPVHAARGYEGPIVRAVQRLKYGGRPDLAAPLARLVVEVAPELRGALLIPVPVHGTRLVERGFNQAALLAREIAALAGARAAARALTRTRAAAHQAGRARAERLELSGAFRARDVPLAGPVFLVDDVVTTGATVCDCSRALRERGLAISGILALCRAAPATRSAAARPPAR